MKDKKKPKGTKTKIQAYKKRSRLVGTAIMVAILVVIIALSSFLIYSYLNSSQNQNASSTIGLKAAIIDHLSLTVPNQNFIQTANNILETANYTVDYYLGKEVDVDFYRNLPTHGYDLIILRVHSALESYEEVSPVVLFTSERYSLDKYKYEQLVNRVGAVAYSMEESQQGIAYFGIMPKFVQYSMKQTFNNSVVIMMGCDGLKYETMAEAFVEKGAKAYIGWNASVSATHTDQATIQLLKHLITENQTIGEAVENTNNEVGPDPAWESTLVVYPETYNYN